MSNLDVLKFDYDAILAAVDKDEYEIKVPRTEFYGEGDQLAEPENEEAWSEENLDKFQSYYVPETVETSESSLKEEIASVSSEISYLETEEETEEEKELKKERAILIDIIKRKILDRMQLRRKNAFLHKKLIDHFKKRRMENVLKEDPKGGPQIESKYLKRLYAYSEFKNSQEKEIQSLTKNMEDYEVSADKLQEQYEEKMKNFMTKARDISLNLISTKTGKKLNEKVVDRLLRRHAEKSEEKGMKKLEYIKVKNLIEEKSLQLKTMEYFGEGLHIVDYEQMKIDNQNYTDKIEEKEDELTKMRLKTQEIIQNLAHVKEKAYAIEGDIELMEEKVYDVDLKFTATRERLTKARKKRDTLREELHRLKSTSGLLNRDNLLKDFEKSIFEAKNHSKNLDRLRKLINEKKKQEDDFIKITRDPSEQWTGNQEKNFSKTPTDEIPSSF